METKVQAARFYRNMVRQICEMYAPIPAIDDNARFFRYLEQRYDNAKRRIQNLLDKHAEVSEIDLERHALFVFAAGLLTYGRVDVVDDILAHIPPSGHVRRLAWTVSTLMPMPTELDPLDNLDDATAWIQENRTRLNWNVKEEKFTLNL